MLALKFVIFNIQGVVTSTEPFAMFNCIKHALHTRCIDEFKCLTLFLPALQMLMAYLLVLYMHGWRYSITKAG